MNVHAIPDPLGAHADVFPAERRLYYGGGWHDPKAGGTLAVTAPASGHDLGTVSAADAADLDLAVAAAHKGQREWKALAPLARARVLRAVIDRIRAHRDELAMLDAIDCGNPLKGMLFDVDLGTTLLEYFTGLAPEVKGETIPSGDGRMTFVRREPIGVVARIIPFNHPMMFVLAKMGAPLVAGNAVIFKPSEHTPLAALRIAELIGDLFPAGLFSVLNGDGRLGAAMAEHPGIGNVSLVGSATTGRAVMRAGASTLKRLTLELGGKNALIMWPDADIDKAVAGAVKGMNLGWTGGQSCGSTSRVLVHDSIHDEVVERLAAAFDAVKLGDPTSPETEMGCMSTRPQFDKVMSYIEAGRQDGARMVAGGAVPDHLSEGLFVRPAVFSDVTPGMRIASEEVFGPLLSVLRWHDEEEMFALANSVEYGLTASIWTRDINTAMRAVERLDAGYVWINNSSDHYAGAPFGGLKQSGIGREECLDEILGYTEQKTVAITFGN